MASKDTLAQCSSCRRDTKHKILKETSTSHSRDDPQYEAQFGERIYWTNIYEIVQCQICDAVGFRRRTWFNPTEEWDSAEYPPPKPKELPSWHARLPPKLADLAVEVYRAVECDSRRLALMGIRSLLDLLATDRVGDIGSFEEKVDGLVTAGVVTARNRTALLAAIDAGSAAVHRGHQPSTEDLDRALDITETILSSVYHLPIVGDQLRLTTPPRPPRSKQKKP